MAEKMQINRFETSIPAALLFMCIETYTFSFPMPVLFYSGLYFFLYSFDLSFVGAPFLSLCVRCIPWLSSKSECRHRCCRRRR